MSNVTKFPPRGNRGNLHVERAGDRVALDVTAPWLSDKPIGITLSVEDAERVACTLMGHAQAIRASVSVTEDAGAVSARKTFGDHCALAYSRAKAGSCDAVCTCGNVWGADGKVTVRRKR